MDIIKRLFRKESFYYYKKSYPLCGREFCYCIKTTDLKNKQNLKKYFECYRKWYTYLNQ